VSDEAVGDELGDRCEGGGDSQKLPGAESPTGKDDTGGGETPEQDGTGPIIRPVVLCWLSGGFIHFKEWRRFVVCSD